MGENNTNSNNINADCLKCVYFANTWEPKYPRMCRLFGFKTSNMPSLTVYKSSGSPCTNFIKKEPKSLQKR